MIILIFVICFIASALGAIAGFGGGVIIKPVLDLIGILPVSTVSFLSGCTAFTMAITSLIRSRGNEIKLEIGTSTPLAIGAVFGGSIGKALLEIVRINFYSENVLGLIQAVFLLAITLFVFFYICKKDNLKSLNIKNIFVCFIIGTLLGIISSFLGIGGGTSNIAILFFFFSMDAKTAAKNSLYIIMFSQAASIISSLISNTVPIFELTTLISMICGGISGAIIGAFLSEKMESKMVENLLKALLIIIICTNAYNVISYGLRV